MWGMSGRSLHTNHNSTNLQCTQFQNSQSQNQLRQNQRNSTNQNVAPEHVRLRDGHNFNNNNNNNYSRQTIQTNITNTINPTVLLQNHALALKNGSHWGDKLCKKQDVYFRIGCQNINGLPWMQVIQRMMK